MTHLGNKMKGPWWVSGSDFNFSSVVTFLCLLLLSDRIRSQEAENQPKSPGQKLRVSKEALGVTQKEQHNSHRHPLT